MALLKQTLTASLIFILLVLVSASCAPHDKDNLQYNSGDDQMDDDQADDDQIDDDSGDDDSESEGKIITLESQSVIVKVWSNPFGLQILSKEKEVVTMTSNYSTSHSLYYSRNGEKYYLESLTSKENIENGVALHFRTTEGGGAKVTVSFATDRSVKVTLSLDKTDGWLWAGQDMQLFNEEAIYGLTERISSSYLDSELYPKEIGSLNRRGEWIPMIVIRSIGIYTPFYHSSRGYGLYVDSTFYGIYDVGQQKADRLRFTFNTAKGHDPILTYYLFYGPSHDAILDEYTSLTGRPFIPPLWAFGHWRWRDEDAFVTGELDGHIINGQVAEDVLKYEEFGFPIGNYMIDRPWTPGDQGFAEFAWDETRFPNPDAMRKSLFDRGYHLIIWGAPWAIGWDPGQNGYEAEQYGYYAPHSRTFIDFTNPAAYEWWKNKVLNFSLADNVHGWKLDRGDEDQPSTWFDIYWDGRSGAEVRNAYPVIYQKCYFDAMQEAYGDDFVNVFRAGYSGSQQYGIANNGDVRGALSKNPDDSTDLGLRSSIISQLRCAFMGFPIWGSNTGGYQEFRNREVFARWLEFSAFSALMDIGGTGNHAPWDMPTEPQFDEEMIDIYRYYTKLHHELAPYIHEYAQSSAQTGRAVSRPLVFDYPDDPNVKDMWDEYFYGPDMLVAPVWKIGVRQRDVYIPAGEFIDYWNPSETVVGPDTISADVPLNHIPIYIRKGSKIMGRNW